MTLLKSVPSNVSQTVKLEPTKEMLNLYKKMKSNAGNDKVTELWKTPS
jgi:hypothetical protein